MLISNATAFIMFVYEGASHFCSHSNVIQSMEFEGPTFWLRIQTLVGHKTFQKLVY